MGEGERTEILRVKHSVFDIEVKDKKRKLQPNPTTLMDIKNTKF